MSKLVILYTRKVRAVGDRFERSTDFRIVLDLGTPHAPITAHEVKSIDGLGDVSWRKVGGEHTSEHAVESAMIVKALEAMCFAYWPDEIRTLASSKVSRSTLPGVALVIEMGIQS